ncbi:hypothetical protein [Aquaspirillum sp. LM1]|uniref:hypothetical protein n=1 Tax=Aquaspirillum sp. LM1 TaxID=1938604 RepID=UPI0015C56927|nr:hypothetical protein [Aquaspirillum sp. LM1]
MAKMGRPAKIQADDAAQLVAIVESDRTATNSSKSKAVAILDPLWVKTGWFEVLLPS